MNRRFRLLALAWALMIALMIARAAVASERTDLLDCYEAIEEFSQGPGDDIGRWEQWSGDSHDPHHRATLAVPGDRAGAHGVYFFTEEGAYFAAKPLDSDTQLFGFHFDLTLPNRYPFRCELSSRAASWADVAAKRYREGTQCWAFNEQATPGHTYHPVRPKALPMREDAESWLRSVISERLSSVYVTYRREVEQYRKDLQAYLRPQESTGIAGAWRSFMGVVPTRPAPPSPDRRLSALHACQFPDSGNLASQVRTVGEMVLNTPVPDERTICLDCGN